MSTPFHCVRFLLRGKRGIEIPGQQGAMLYALMCNANAPQGQPLYPADFMLNCPEQTRTMVQQNQTFAFGGTIIADNGQRAKELLQRLATGLQRCGRAGKSRSRGLGGNYDLVEVQDLVSGNVLLCKSASDVDLEEKQTGTPDELEFNTEQILQSIPLSNIDREIQTLQSTPELTLRFTAPVRIERPRKRRKSGRSCMDDDYFELSIFVRAVVRRLANLGIVSKDDQANWKELNVQLLDNQLVWLDMAYGGKHGKTLGGLVGALRIKATQLPVLAALVWGQYAGVGKNTNFGFGRYRIDELGSDPFQCHRSESLLNLAWNHPESDRLAMRSELEPGHLSSTIQSIRLGTYRPDQHVRIKIGDPPKQRHLQIPSRRDRVIQRLVLETIGPGIDQLFQSSSFAWRRGLSRHKSARMIKTYYGQGYHYAVHADFDNFFQTIPHDILWRRLSAYVADDAVVELIRSWILSATNEKKGFGIPTGAPISPMLGNLLLDRFDEKVRQSGGRLVRYGDDFLILVKDRQQAVEMAQVADDLAEQLQLKLNDTDSPIVDFEKPFEFLGFQFLKEKQWIKSGDNHPKPLEELGWLDASAKKKKASDLLMSGESGQSAKDIGYTAILGPNATHLQWQPDHLVCHYLKGRKSSEIPLQDLENLVVMGKLGINAQTLQQLTEQQVKLFLADDHGQIFATVCGDYDLNADVVAEQAVMMKATGAERRLCLAKSLVAAKLHNYSVLAHMHPKLKHIVSRLKSAQAQADGAERIDKLLGTEGYAAAIWFGVLESGLENGFRFQQRVALNATDPVNVLLNIGYSLLYRLIMQSIRTAGLCGSIGILHESNSRFQALASDLQEPFRFLIDRCVIQATQYLQPRDFRESNEGRYSLVIKPSAVRWYQKLLWESFHRETSDQGDSASSYLVMLQRQSRSLRRHLMHPETPFQPFLLKEPESAD